MKKDLQQNLNPVFTMKKTIFLLMVFLMVSASSFATTYYSRATGNWNEYDTWSLTSGGAAAGAFPTINDDVIIDKGFTVTVAANAECKTIKFAIGLDINNTLIIADGITLNVTGNVYIPRGFFDNSNNSNSSSNNNGQNYFYVNAGNAIIGGSLSFTSDLLNGTQPNSRHRVYITTGALTVMGNITGTSSDSRIYFDGVNQQNEGFLNLSGNMSSSNTLDLRSTNSGKIKVNYNGTNTQAIGNDTYDKLILSNSGSKTISGTITATDLAINTTGAATVSLSSSSSLTATTLTITSSTSDKIITLGTGTPTGALKLNGALTVDYTGSNALGAVIDSPITMLANTTFTVNNPTLLLNGIVSGTSRSLIKNGLGKLQLSAANTYTGSTIINEGKLELGASNRIATSAFTFGGGTFSTGASTGNSDTVGRLNLTPATSSTISLGTGVHTLTYTASSGTPFGAGATLTIKGWQGTLGASGTAGKIFVGTTATGLLDTQLAQISFEGYSCGAMLLSTGELVPRNSSTTYTASGWSNNEPTSGVRAIISANLTINADFNACSLQVTNNAVVTVNSGFNVSLYGAVTVDAGSTLTFNNNAGLLQSTDATNSGAIIVKRTTNPIIRLDYTLWSSPVANQGLFSFSPLTAVSPTVRFYSYTTSANSYAAVSSASINTEKFGTAKGYLIRLPYNHPTAPVAWTGTFTGVPNNGPKTIALTSNDPTKLFNLIGNPYPSPISIDQFMADNGNNVEPTLYFWRKTNGASTTSYCTLNTSTNTFNTNNETYALDPNGVIQTGQGFFVKAKAGAAEVVFNNRQRIANTTNQFFKTTSTAITTEAHRIWLNITGTGTEFSQAVVGYFTNGTDTVDVTDSKSFSDGTISLTSILETADYSIQGRSLPFQATDVVPMKYKVTNAGTYTIAIDHVDGLFSGAAQTVYLKDNVLGTYNNLTAGSYVFASAAGTFANRFELVYQDMLSTTTNMFNANQVVVYKQDNQVVVNTGNTSMSSVVVYDIQGRVLVSKTNINATETKLNLDSTNQVLLLEITDIDGLKVTKKIVN